MVKVGFIVEGASEKIIVESQNFRNFLSKNGYELMMPVIDANGGGNLLPKNIEPHLTTLKTKNPDVAEIYILTDLEKQPNVEELRNSLKHNEIKFTFIAVKAIEAWFLADTVALKNWLKKDDVQPENCPEQSGDKMPWDYLNDVAKKYEARGTGSSKPMFAQKMLKCGFDIERAAEHENCPSAKELVKHFSVA